MSQGIRCPFIVTYVRIHLPFLSSICDSETSERTAGGVEWVIEVDVQVSEVKQHHLFILFADFGPGLPGDQSLRHFRFIPDNKTMV